jgi:hypothetical protein
METQTAYARSAISDPSNIINFLALALMMPEIREVIPPRYIPLVAAIVALSNLALRTLFVTHPVAMIAPGQVKPDEVKKLNATKQGTEEAENLPAELPSGEVPK